MVREGHFVEYVDDVVDVVEIGDGLVEGGDDAHGMTLQGGATAQVSQGGKVLKLAEKLQNLRVRLEQPE